MSEIEKIIRQKTIYIMFSTSKLSLKKVYDILIDKSINAANRDHVSEDGTPKINGFFNVKISEGSINAYMVYLKKIPGVRKIRIVGDTIRVEKEEVKLPYVAEIRVRSLKSLFFEIFSSDNTARKTLRSLLAGFIHPIPRKTWLCDDVMMYIHDNIWVTDTYITDLTAPDGTRKIKYATITNADATMTNADKTYYDPEKVWSLTAYALTSKNIQVPITIYRDGHITIKQLDQLEPNEVRDLINKVTRALQQLYCDLCLEKKQKTTALQNVFVAKRHK